MTDIGDRITRVRQEGFVHGATYAKGFNPYHATNEWAESDAWLQGHRDGRTFAHLYRDLPSDLASWHSTAALELKAVNSGV